MEKLRDIGFVIIADDNEFKRKTIHEYMEKLYPKAEFAESASVNSTLRFLCCTLPDKKILPEENILVILDMCMPLYIDKSAPDMPYADAGFDVLQELNRKQMYYPVIIASSDGADTNKAKSIYAGTLGAVKEDLCTYTLPYYKELLCVEDSAEEFSDS